MKTIFFALLSATLLSTPAHADQAEHCLKIGETIELYGAVDKYHFFHDGNGMRVTSILLRIPRAVCVDASEAAGEPNEQTWAFQLMIDQDLPSDLNDGDLIKIKGTYTGFGDTLWYSGSPLLENLTVTKRYDTDPAADFLNQ